MERLQLISIPVTLGSYREVLDKICLLASQRESSYTCVANVHMLVEAYRNKKFASVVENATVITADGKPITWAMKWLLGVDQSRIAGMDLLPDLVKEAALRNIRLYFYGGTEELLTKTKEHLKEAHKTLKVVGMYSPPFRELDLQEKEECIKRMNDSGAQLVFVVLGCPKQEEWMASMKGRVNAMMVGVGGALPVMIHQQKRAPRWMQSMGLEWLHRLVQDPYRLFARYAITNTVFLYLLVRENLKKIGFIMKHRAPEAQP
jgi:N-acetylglucosaminyldiphosphoundecaprenol N-acetyl-beta-D-mannosaminyltransferase